MILFYISAVIVGGVILFFIYDMIREKIAYNKCKQYNTFNEMKNMCRRYRGKWPRKYNERVLALIGTPVCWPGVNDKRLSKFNQKMRDKYDQ